MNGAPAIVVEATDEIKEYRPPKVLFEFSAGWAMPLRNYDISRPDGRRFLIRELQKYDPTPVTELNLVRNWFGELKRLSPAGK